MKYAAPVLLIGLAAGWAQTPRQDTPENIRLPNGKVWSDVIARADHEKNLADAEEIVRLTTEIRDEIGSGEAFVLSLKTLKKVEQAEKRLKDLRSRMRRN
jgi:hypothetical protein